MTEYDNTNRGSLWKVTKAASGKVNIGGVEFYASLVSTKSDKPTYNLFLTQVESRFCTLVALFKPDKESVKAIAGGSVEMNGVGYWVNVYPADPSENPKAPDLRIGCAVKEPPTGYGEPKTQEEDDIPW